MATRKIYTITVTIAFEEDHPSADRITALIENEVEEQLTSAVDTLLPYDNVEVDAELNEVQRERGAQ